MMSEYRNKNYIKVILKRDTRAKTNELSGPQLAPQHMLFIDKM